MVLLERRLRFLDQIPETDRVLLVLRVPPVCRLASTWRSGSSASSTTSTTPASSNGPCSTTPPRPTRPKSEGRELQQLLHEGDVEPLSEFASDLALDAHQGEPAAGVQVFSPKTALEVRKMLQMAAGPGGTGQKAQTLGYSVGGKSGTAYKQVGKSYGTDKDRKYRGWFVGMAPIDKPRVIVAVMIDEPRAGKYYGGEVAAPVFSELVQQALRMKGVQPDMSVKPQIVTQAVEESF